MKVVIPLAGFGTRLRPHTFTKPKPLINVAGKPVLGHVLDMFKSIPVDEFIFITGYLDLVLRNALPPGASLLQKPFSLRALLGELDKLRRA